MKNNKMKQVLMIFAFLLFAGFISAEEVNYSYTYSYEGVQVTNLKYEPYPVNPGEYFDIWFKVVLGSSVDYVKFEIVDSFPFSIDGSEDPVREYGNTESREVVMHYKIRVDNDAVEGVNELKLKIVTSKSYEGDIFGIFEIYVTDAQTDFDMVLQDSSDSEISLAIANIGKNTANSMIVRIPTQEGYIVSGTSGQMVGNLDSGDYTIVSFEVSESRGSDGNLNVQIDYTDSIGERRTIVKEISFSSGFPMQNLTGSFEGDSELPDGFEGMGMPGMKGNFPGQQQKAKWPYFLAVGLILIFAGFIVYGKYKRQIKSYLREKQNNKIKEKSKEGSSIPDWMIKEIKKTKKG